MTRPSTRAPHARPPHQPMSVHHRFTPALLLALVAALSACSSGLTNTGSDGGDGGTVLLGDAGDGGVAGLGGAGDGGSLADAGLLLPGDSCDSDRACGSMVCGANGVGHCCVQSCSKGQAGCGATDCDGLGACVFLPAGEPCGGRSCAEGALTDAACDGRGGCKPAAPQPCPGHLACANPVSCLASCDPTNGPGNGPGDGGSCGAGFYCDSTGLQCRPQQTTGGCNSDAVCVSGLCLGGSCCGQSCLLDGGTCAPAECDLATGACLYAAATTPCGPLASASCATAALTTEYCSGAGRCAAAPSTQPCQHDLVCDPAHTGCLAVCAQDADCIPSDFCTPAPAEPQCCPRLPPGGELFVDAATGADQGCCGSAEQPCATLSYAMSVVDHSRAPGVTIRARQERYDNPLALGLSYGVWSPPAPGEQYPVHLGWGVTLEATNLSFLSLAGDTFAVYPYPGEPDGGLVAIVSQADAGPLSASGSPTDQFGGTLSPVVTIGKANDLLVSAPPGVVGVEDGLPGLGGLPLRLSGVQLSGGAAGLKVGPGGDVKLGPGQVSFVGSNSGLLCRGTASLPAKVESLDLAAPMTFSRDAYQDVDLEDGCAAQLSALSIAYGSVGPTANCDYRDYQSVVLESIRVAGTARALIANSTFSCPFQEALHLLASDAGAPAVTLSSSTLYGAGCAGIWVEAGDLRVTSSNLNSNSLAVLVTGQPNTVDLSTGDAGSPNQVNFGQIGTSTQAPAAIPPSCPPQPLNTPANLRTSNYGVVNASAATANLAGALLGGGTCSAANVLTCDSTYTQCAGGVNAAVGFQAQNYQAIDLTANAATAFAGCN